MAGAKVFAAVAVLGVAASASASTFTPTAFTSPYVSRVIPKFTERVAQDSLHGGVFAALGPSVTYTLENCGKYVRFTLDPYRNRVVFARNEALTGAFGGRGSGNGLYENPQDITVYYDKTLVIADTGNDRLVFIDWFDNITLVNGNICQVQYPNQGAIVPMFLWNVGVAQGISFNKPTGVSVDDRGTSTNVGDDILWVADSGNNRICRLQVNTNNGAVQYLGSYGSFGAGVGQFNLPLRVIRGRTAANGDPASSRNNSDLFVLDHGNSRIVKLHCDSLSTGLAATWVGSFSLPGALFESIAADAWGNIYVTDSRGHRVTKFSPNLELLDEYGHFGFGVQDGSMCQPMDFRPQFMPMSWANPPQYVATNFALLSERWGEQSGGQGYILGVDIADPYVTATQTGAWLHFKLTDHAFLKILVLDPAGAIVKTIDGGTTFRSSGSDSVFWDGREEDGTTLPCNSYRFRMIPRTGYSSTFDTTLTATVTFEHGIPQPATLTVRSTPSNAAFLLDGTAVNAGANGYVVPCTTCTASGVKQLTAPVIQFLGGVRHRFASWSDGGPSTHLLTILGDTEIVLNLASDDAAGALLQAPYLSSDVGLQPMALDGADFNGDGAIDLAVANKGANSVSILMGRGDGTYMPQTAIPVAGSPHAIAVGDLNGDGRKDIALACESANAVATLLGLGGGGFVPGQTVACGQTPRSVSIGDVTGDGRADVAAANFGSGTVSVIPQLANGSLGVASTHQVGGAPSCVQVAQLRAGALKDLVVTDNGGASAKVLLADGLGGFAAPVPYQVGTNPSHVRVVDVSGDGVGDMVVANAGAGTVSVLAGVGNGSFAPRQDYAVGVGPTAVGIADFNRDGRADIAVSNGGAGENSVSVLPGQVGGGFGSATTWPVGREPVGLLAMDLTSDLRTDMAAVCRYSNSVSMLASNGDGTFGMRREFSTGAVPSAVSLGDLSGDGKLDLVTANNVEVGTVSVLLGAGNGDFGNRADYPAGLYPRDIVAADLSGDDILDIVVTNQTSNTVSILRGLGGGALGTKTDYSTDYYPIALATGDLNGDGLRDLVTANNDGGTVSIRLGVGNGILGSRTDVTVGTAPHNPMLVDLNQDGKLDLLVRRENAVAVLHGNGAGALGPPQNLITGFPSGARFALGDVNSDGLLDLVTSGLLVYLQLEPEVFVAGVPYVGGVSFSDVALVDLSGDGHLDIVTLSEGVVQVLLGRGDGTFAPKTDFGTVPDPVGLAFGDVNLDGRIDVATAGWASASKAAILLNRGTITGAEQAPTPPKKILLGQNRPNPFNPETIIDFNLSSSGHVSLMVFGPSGRLVARLVDKVLPAGKHEVRWAGRNDVGQAVASGVYFYRLSTGGRQLTRKMVLLK